VTHSISEKDKDEENRSPSQQVEKSNSHVPKIVGKKLNSEAEELSIDSKLLKSHGEKLNSEVEKTTNDAEELNSHVLKSNSMLKRSDDKMANSVVEDKNSAAKESDSSEESDGYEEWGEEEEEATKDDEIPSDLVQVGQIMKCRYRYLCECTVPAHVNLFSFV
jgi:hypothetical protein